MANPRRSVAWASLITTFTILAIMALVIQTYLGFAFGAYGRAYVAGRVPQGIDRLLLQFQQWVSALVALSVAALIAGLLTVTEANRRMLRRVDSSASDISPYRVALVTAIAAVSYFALFVLSSFVSGGGLISLSFWVAGWPGMVWCSAWIGAAPERSDRRRTVWVAALLAVVVLTYLITFWFCAFFPSILDDPALHRAIAHALSVN